MVTLTFHGCGDAFGSGGRFNTCFQVVGDTLNFLIDCGATSMVPLKKSGVVLHEIQLILITHFHADHFGGLPFFMLEAQFFSKRQRPLTIAGPPGLQKQFERVMESSFPGSSVVKPRFDLTFIELHNRETTAFADLRVTPFFVNHGRQGGPFYAYRIKFEKRVIGYTGDTEWTDTLIDVGKQADLFIAEAYFFDKQVKLHLDYKTLIAHLPQIDPKRVILTHMSENMLAHAAQIPHETAHDGLVIHL
ncbi:MAG: MBL fold metallo-hydrolase [Ardenticatenaceae bacterium]|nr:MBL fold metallo-hydrolase [Ardenticatenaceae bacterium]